MESAAPDRLIRTDDEDVKARWRDSLAHAAESAYRRASADELPTEARRVRWRLEPRTALSAAFVIGIAALLAWAFVTGGPEETLGAEQERSADPAASASADPFMSEPSAAPVVVHVAGAVASPGLVQLNPGERVADALEDAGGPLDDANLAAVNLARVPVDGEQIVVPAAGETSEAAASVPGKVSISTADAAALQELPGIGPVLAERIVADRESNGPFTSLDDLSRVSGIGDALVAGLTDLAVP